MSSLPTREEYVQRWAALHGGYDPSGSTLVGGWLRVVHACARPLARAGIRPDVLTLLAVLVSASAVPPASAGGGWRWLAGGLVLLAGLLDGLDGAVAVLTDRASRWGFVLDSAADRCSDVLFLVALWAAGAPVGACVAAGVVSWLLEYVRARAGAAGMPEVGVVTVAERPTRVLVTAGFLAAGLAEVGAWVWLAVSVVGLLQLVVVVRRRLTVLPPG